MDARRVSAARALWSALSGTRRPGAPGVGRRLAALPRMLSAALGGRYPDLSRGRVALMAAAVLYLLSPVDLVPELVFLVVGLVDDALVVSWLAGTVLAETDRFLAWEDRRDRVVPGEVLGSARIRR